MENKEEEIVEKLNSLSNDYEEMLKEYGTYCYNFYNKPTDDYFNNLKMEVTEEMIRNDDALSDDEKEQLILIQAMPHNWESIHKHYCSALSEILNKSTALSEELKLIRYNKEMDETLAAILKNNAS